MFGEMHPPKPKPRVLPVPVPVDYHMPCPEPYCWAHPGRAADTDHHVKMLLYKQRKDADYVRSIEGTKGQMDKDKFSTKFDRHAEKRRFQGEIKKRVDILLQEYDDAIDRRREKLKELYAKEERDFYRETVDTCQRGGETRMETMKKRAEVLIAKREAERLEVVKEKKLQQHMLRSVDLRGALAKKNLVESKNIQLQQIRENEAQREYERETDKMWHNLAMKDAQAQLEREQYDALDRYERDKANKAVWEIQVQAKELLKAEAERIAQEDRVEMEKLREQLRREEIEALLAKDRKRDKADRDLREQLKVQEEFLHQRKKEEDALEQAFTLLAQMELDKEIASVQDTTVAAKREMAQYRVSLTELEKQRQEEAVKLDELLNEHKLEIQRKQDDAKCKIEAAKKKLHKDVMKGRDEQVQHKREIAERELKRKQAEDELLHLAYETNGKLAAETARQEMVARQQYKQDLTKQIEYNKELRGRERREMERQLAEGQAEEQRFQKLVSDMCAGKTVAGQKHPFRRTLERYDCHCSPIVKPPY